MAIVITINAVDRTSLVQKNTLNIQDVLNSRNFCSFILKDKTNTYRPSPGQSITVALDGTTIFAGTIDNILEKTLKQASAIATILYTIQCVDYNQLTDRYLVAEVYENKTIGYIVKDIVDNYLNDDSITYANVEDGITITKAVFTYIPVSQAFDELSDLGGMDWYIDYDKDLHFFERETNIASTDLSDANTNILEIEVQRNRELYRNRQYLRAGFDITSERTEYFEGNTKLTTFTTQYPVAKEPTANQYAFTANDTAEAGTTTTNIKMTGHGLITGDLIVNSTRANAIRTVTFVDVDNITVSTVTGQTTSDTIKKYQKSAKTVGIRGLESGFDWYWNKSEKEMTQDDTGTLLTSNDILGVTYEGFYPIIARADDELEISDRITVEGGSGIYEAVEEDRSIESQDTAKEKAEGLLRRYGDIPEKVKILTFENSYKAGQLVNIIQSDHSLNASYLIYSVMVKEYGLTYIYEVLALSGENLGGWISFFKNLIKLGTKYVIRENEVLLRITKLRDSITLSDSLTFPDDEELSDSITLAQSLTVTDATPENRIGFAEIGFSEID